MGNYLRATASYTDRRSSNKTASAILPTRIADLDDKPTANASPEFAETSYDRSIGQGGVAGRNVGAPVRATDEDRDEVLTYSLTGSDSGKFDIDPATGQIKTRDALDYDPNGTNTYSVSVQVSDGFDSAYSPSPSVDATTSVTITVTQVTVTITTGTGGGGGGGGFGAALIAPKFVDGFRTTRPLAQNARPGDAIGDPVAATHANDDDVTFSLSGANASLFTVDELTGQIRLGADVSLVVGQTYTVNLTATDESGTGAIIIIVIEVVEGLADPYDLNGNGSIEKNEVIMAVADYFAGEISKEEILALLSRYFAG